MTYMSKIRIHYSSVNTESEYITYFKELGELNLLLRTDNDY